MGDFTEKAEAIIQQAKEIAKERQCNCVSSAHVLLSFLKAEELGDREQPWSLHEAGITYPKVLEKARKGTCFPSVSDAPWTDDAQNILKEARRAARRLGSASCGTRHLLIGLLKANDSARELIRELAPGFNPKIILDSFLEPPVQIPGEASVRAEERKKEIYVHIRWMIRRDMPEVIEIEGKSFEFPWMDEDFVRCLRQRNCIGMVAEHDDKVVGFMIYELHKTRIHVLNFAIDPDYRRRGVGSQMVAKLIAKLSCQRRSRIVLEVRESNLAAQLFFRENDFRSVCTLRNFYEDTPEDAYLMQYRYDPKKDPQPDPPRNRTVRLAG